MVKNPNWQEADQLAIYKRGRGVELGATEKQLLLAVRAELEPGASELQVTHSSGHPGFFSVSTMMMIMIIIMMIV